MNGWVKMHVKFIENEIWQRDPTAWRVFEFLLARAFSDKTRPLGSLVTTRQQIQMYVGGNSSTIFKAIKRLEKADMVTTRGTAKNTEITIVNWSQYQDNGNSSGNSRVTTESQLSNSLIKTKNKTKNINTNVFVNKLFTELVEILGFSKQTKLTEQRRRKLRARLRNFSEADLRNAAKAIAEDDFLQGSNDSGKRYGTIDYLIRNDEIIDRYKEQITAEISLKDFEIKE